jgi:hypothetical protein
MSDQTARLRPENINQYLDWLIQDRAVPATALTPELYRQRLRLIADHIRNSSLWTELISELTGWSDRYSIDAGCTLFAFPFGDLVEKSFKSVLDKAFRTDILYNPCWPDTPRRDQDWLVPDNWWRQINDLVRTQWVVKFLDGVTFLCDSLVSYFRGHDIHSRLVFHANDWGYYAAHVYFQPSVSVPFLSEVSTITVELQVTTQLQEVIYPITHNHYERRRLVPRSAEQKWQWQIDSPEFTVNYLGHMLHYMEGLIVKARREGVPDVATG